jgi:hypothetical protein
MRACLPIAIGTVMLLTASAAYAAGYRIGPASQQEGPSHASVGVSVRVSSPTPGAPGASEDGSASSSPLGEPASSSGTEAEPRTVNGETCLELPAPTVPCYGVTPAAPQAPGKPAKSRPAINPAVLAATVASRMSLLAGAIEASPSAHTAGLTGAASWFWLAPSPAPQSLSVSAGAERVTVTAAVGSVRWDFGDGNSLIAGPGVPYHPGAVPTGAVRHVYETRCLPGDQGHDPNVSASCGPGGYQVRAVVEWTISYQAAGPVTAGGALPARATDTTISYPVSEVRAFLTGAGGR